jgi:heterodisulfide reductase subunit C2
MTRVAEIVNLSANNFADEIVKESGENPLLCYQCGNCTAGCPYTPFFDFPVNQIMRLIQTGQREAVLSSRAIWLCATCETCTSRCPCEIDVAYIVDTLRNMAFREKRHTEKDIENFYECFLSSLKGHGRIFELGILIRYKLRYKLASGALLSDAELGVPVMLKGLMHLLPSNIKGKDEVVKIFNRFAEKRNSHG